MRVPSLSPFAPKKLARALLVALSVAGKAPITTADHKQPR